MSKYLYFTDGHAQGVNSCNRLGNYFKDWLIKFDELLKIAKDNNCEAILDGGDLFETKNPAYNILDEIADRVEKNGIPIIGLFGNHAMSYCDIKNSANTGLAHLQKRSKLFKYLTEIKNKNFIIKGIDYSFGIEDKLKNEFIYNDSENTNDNYDGMWKILLVHALIMPNKFFKNVSHVLPSEIKTNADLVLCGHYHHPFYKKVGNVEFLNIGAFGRLPINEAKIEPSVLLLDTDKRSYEIIKLKTAKKGSEIFDLSKYEEDKAEGKDISEFLESMQNINLQSMDITEQISLIGKEQKIDSNVIEYLINKIEVIKDE